MSAYNDKSEIKQQQSGINDSIAGSNKRSDHLELFAEYSEQQKQNATRQKLDNLYPSSIINAQKQSSDQNSSSEKESNGNNIAINLVSNFDASEINQNEIKNDANNVKNSVIEHPIEEQKDKSENTAKEANIASEEKNNNAGKNNEIPVKNESKNVEQNNISQKQVSQKQSSQTKKDAKSKNNSKNNLQTKEKTKEINKNNKKKEPKKNITKQRSNKVNATSKDKSTQKQEIIKNFKTTNHLTKNVVANQKQLTNYASNVVRERERLIQKLQSQKNDLLKKMKTNPRNKVFSNIQKDIMQLNQDMEKLKLDAKDGKYNYTFVPNIVKIGLLEKKRTAKPTVNTKKTVKKDPVLNKKKTGQAKITTTKIKKEPKQLGSKTLSSNLNKIDKKNDIHEEPKPLMEKTLSNLNKIDKKEVISKEQTDNKMQKNFNKGTLPENKAKKQENIDLTGIDTSHQFDKSINMEWFSNERKGSMIQHENEFFSAIRKNFKKAELNEKDHSIQQNDNFLLNIKNNLKHVPDKGQEQMKKSVVNNIEIIEEKKEEKKENNNVQVQKPQGKVDKKNSKNTVIKKNTIKIGVKTKKQKIPQYNNMSASNNINKNPKIILKQKNKVNGFGK